MQVSPGTDSGDEHVAEGEPQVHTNAPEHSAILHEPPAVRRSGRVMGQPDRVDPNAHGRVVSRVRAARPDLSYQHLLLQVRGVALNVR
jgi:hypothetical protein